MYTVRYVQHSVIVEFNIINIIYCFGPDSPGSQTPELPDVLDLVSLAERAAAAVTPLLQGTS